MLTKGLRLLILVIVISSMGTVVLASEKQQQKEQARQQKKLDKACETARQVALKPRKKEIYQECRQKYKKSESVCNREANVYNGNRINGAPLFYELPACEKAFVFRNKNIEK